MTTIPIRREDSAPAQAQTLRLNVETRGDTALMRLKMAEFENLTKIAG